MRILAARIRGEFVHRQLRSLVIAFAVMVGTTVLSAALISNSVLSKAIPESYARSLPPTCVLALGHQSENALNLLEEYPEVEAVELRRVLRGRIATREGNFASLSLTVLAGGAHHGVSRVTLAPESSGIFVERSSIQVWGFEGGDVARVRFPGGAQHQLPTVGVAADAAVAPGFQDRIVYLYATPDAVAILGDLTPFDELRLRLHKGYDLTTVLDKLAADGIAPDRVERVLQQHPHADQMHAVLLVLMVFAVAALIVATALVTNIVAIAMRSETRMIGLQKALGASTQQVVLTALAWVGIISLPAGFLGVALGTFTARGFAEFAARELNLANMPLTPSFGILAIAGFAGTAVPLCGAAIASIKAARVRPLDAILPDRTLGSVPGTRASSQAITLTYALRHLTQKPVKLLLMLLALSTGGAALVTAGSVYRSLSVAVDRIFEHRHDDLDIRLLSPVPQAQVLSAIRGSEIDLVEAWGGLLVSFAESESQVSGTRFGLLAPIKDTKLMTLPIAEGRWLGDETVQEIVATRSLLARTPGLNVGDEITLARGAARVPVIIVGAVEEATEPGVFATRRVHDQLVGRPGLIGALRIKTTGNAADAVKVIEDRLFSQGIVPVLLFDTGELRLATREHFAILLTLLGTVGTSALLVGAAALWSSVTVSIMERRREIAVMRAIGARNSVVHRIFALESGLLAGLAALTSMLIAIPMSVLLATMLGHHALHIDVGLSISWTAVMIWLMVLSIVMCIATTVPLSRELRHTPAKNLSYE